MQHPGVYVGCNFAIPQDQCTLATCCLAQSQFLYLPNFGGNLFFAIYFGVFLLPQLALACYYRTWGFGVGMVIGLALEVVGYAARLLLHNDPFSRSWGLMYLICLTIAPVFMTAAIYLSLTRIMVLYGEHLSFVRPRTIATTFMISDFCSLVLQGIGGGAAASQTTVHGARQGLDTMIAGLLLQAVSIAVFLSFMVYFSVRCRTGVTNMDPVKQKVRQRTIFAIFIVGLLVATLAVLIRSVFRVAELWEGFAGPIWNNETEFFIFDGAMVSLAVLLLTVLHPGIAFGGEWSAANWSFRSKKRDVSEQNSNSDK